MTTPRAVAVACVVCLSASMARASGLGDIPDAEPPPLVSTILPFSPSGVLVDFWSITNYMLHQGLVDSVNSELKDAQRQAIATGMLLEASRHIHAGEARFNSLIAPANAPRKGKLQRDVETWERRYPQFRFGREAVAGDPRQARLFEKYITLRDQFIPEWDGRVRPCIEHLNRQMQAVRLAVNKPLTAPDLEKVSQSIRAHILGASDPEAPIRLGGRDYGPGDGDALLTALGKATPAETLALCRERGPLPVLGLLTAALEREATNLSDDGRTPLSEMRVTVYNRAQRIALFLYVKPKGAELDAHAIGLMLLPRDAAPEDQVDPKGVRPASHGMAWVSAEPEDEIWVRAMTMGPRRDLIRYKPVVSRSIRVFPESLPRNFYRLDYGTYFPNPLLTRWTVERETYTWSDFEGPWRVTGQPVAVNATPRMRDPLFGPPATGDVLTWKLPDRDAIERLAELTATVSGTAKLKRVGPRSTIVADDEDKGQGVVAVRVELW